MARPNAVYQSKVSTIYTKVEYIPYGQRAKWWLTMLKQSKVEVNHVQAEQSGE